jgi:toxin ParE1/3/4
LPRLILLPAARDDFDGAIGWYYSRDPNLADRLQAAVDAAFDRILDKPDRFPQIQAPVRRLLLRRFPYAIYYIDQSDLVVVLAVLHHKRDPRIWKRRIPSAV